MEENVSSPIFGSRRWMILVDLLKDILAEIPRIKVLSF
jgi:hypothetical protein